MDEKTERLRERAYEIWEREGKPDGRALEHWLEAERQILGQTGDADRQDREHSVPTSEEGEGGRTDALRYNEAQHRVVRSGQVEKKPKEAQKPLEGDEGPGLREAELAGKQHAAEKSPRKV